MTPSELWAALKVSKQGAMDLLRPLVKSGLVNRLGHVEDLAVRVEMSGHHYAEDELVEQPAKRLLAKPGWSLG